MKKIHTISVTIVLLVWIFTNIVVYNYKSDSVMETVQIMAKPSKEFLTLAHIQELQRGVVNSDIPVNKGGCGVFALKLSNILTRYGIKHSIVIVSNDHSTKYMDDNFCLYIEGNLGSVDVCLNHVYVLLGNNYIDGTDIVKHHNFKSERVVTTHFLECLLAKEERWNSTYGRVEGEQVLNPMFDILDDNLCKVLQFNYEKEI